MIDLHPLRWAVAVGPRAGGSAPVADCGLEEGGVWAAAGEAAPAATEVDDVRGCIDDHAADVADEDRRDRVGGVDGVAAGGAADPVGEAGRAMVCGRSGSARQLGLERSLVDDDVDEGLRRLGVSRRRGGPPEDGEHGVGATLRGRAGELVRRGAGTVLGDGDLPVGEPLSVLVGRQHLGHGRAVQVAEVPPQVPAAREVVADQ